MVLASLLFKLNKSVGSLKEVSTCNDVITVASFNDRIIWILDFRTWTSLSITNIQAGLLTMVPLVCVEFTQERPGKGWRIRLYCHNIDIFWCQWQITASVFFKGYRNIPELTCIIVALYTSLVYLFTWTAVGNDMS